MTIYINDPRENVGVLISTFADGMKIGVVITRKVVNA